MNILGKILAWLLVPLAAVSIVLAARTLEIRNSWTKPVGDLKKENDDLASQIGGLRPEVTRLQEEIEREMYSWETYWDGRRGEPNVPGHAAPNLRAGVGQSEGLGGAARKPGTIVHVFRDLQGGNSEYIGPFRLVEAESNRSTLAPAWLVAPGEPQSWQPGINYRYRTLVPAAFPVRLYALYSALRRSAYETGLEEGNLEDKTAAAKASQSEVEHYETILRGDPAAGAGGLLQDIAVLEEERNKLVADNDALRRQIKRLTGEREGLIEGNRKLLESLGSRKTKPAVTTADAGQN